MKVRRVECKECGCIRQEKLHFVTGKRSYTNKFARYVVGLSRIGTIKDIAQFLNISWDTVKDIQKRYLQRHYGSPDLNGLEFIGIDEFAVRKGHVYKTIVADLVTGHVVYVGDGKGADALDKFWEKVRKKKVRIKAVATDLSAAFISSVMANAPDSTLVFDHFHVVKLMNDTLDKLRRQAYSQEADLMKRKVLKGARWLLLRNGEDIYDSCHRNRLENALEMNAPLMKGYYLKEALREIWMQVTGKQGERVLLDWVKQARDSKVPLLIKFANTLMAHKSGILAWYNYHISTGKLEGINNKIKTMKRQAYGYRDEKFFELKILSLHDKNYAFVG
jgi:transposase